MTPDRLTEWRESRGLSKAAACRLLGVGSVKTWARYESGERPIPRYVALAITAVQHNLPPYE
jgi:transcriptional regulator with XRE-family HTH domain